MPRKSYVSILALAAGQWHLTALLSVKAIAVTLGLTLDDIQCSSDGINGGSGF